MSRKALAAVSKNPPSQSANQRLFTRAVCIFRMSVECLNHITGGSYHESEVERHEPVKRRGVFHTEGAQQISPGPTSRASAASGMIPWECAP